MRTAPFAARVGDAPYPGTRYRADTAGRGRRAPGGPHDLAGSTPLPRRERSPAAAIEIGTNFLVAEADTRATVESEGNNPLRRTRPDTLISVVRVEKIVPTRRDLEVSLQLLARSATGWTDSRRAPTIPEESFRRRWQRPRGAYEGNGHTGTGHGGDTGRHRALGTGHPPGGAGSTPDGRTR
ncbi:LUD domain-containing protein [Nocardia sp. BMG51109]|uniref:LUD domain-containing protein n=1 Tax=Nocardia sp. BMG51109 TaxID=1056816 RepID=UPI000463EA19|nr:LUD domain-containing protein [Nocardia sp. BMG51109]